MLAGAANVVFVGRSQSPSLPSAVKPVPGAANWDSFAVGLNGSTILWTSYYGGSGDDAARGVALDNQGNVYVAGYTNSPDFPFGVPGSYDAYLVKLNAATGALSRDSPRCGVLTDQSDFNCSRLLDILELLNATAIITNPATDPQVTPNVVFGGLTSGGIGQAGSPASTLGKIPDGSQTGFSTCTAPSPGCGTTDGFVAIFSSSLVLLHATYLGGGGNDQVNGVAVDIWGNIYATGFATPNVAPNFPVSRGIAGTALRPGFDAALAPQNAATAFVAKWSCTTGSPAIGVPSPPFGAGALGANSQIPICGGGNTLKTLSNSALFGGSAAGGTFLNPQQTVLGEQNGYRSRPCHCCRSRRLGAAGCHRCRPRRVRQRCRLSEPRSPRAGQFLQSGGSIRGQYTGRYQLRGKRE